MKNLLVAILSFIFISVVNAQMPVSLMNQTWMDGETKKVFNHDIIKVFGEYPDRAQTYNVAPITSIAYKNLDQLLHDLDSVAQLENWTDKKKQDAINKLEQEAPGGRLMIFLSRYSEDRANLKWFFVIIRDNNENEIVEIDLPYQAPQLPEGRGWWNLIEVDISKVVGSDFFVYLNDRQSQHLSDFKFRIENP